MPVVAIDIDGTLGDYHRHFSRFAANYLDVPQPYPEDRYRGDRPYKEWFSSSFHVDLTTFREIKLAYRQGGMKRTMPAFDGVEEFFERTRTAGVEIWLTTTRPYLRLDGIDRDTREWLRRNRIYYDHLMYDEDKYDILASNIDPGRVIAVLDDEVEQLANAERALGPGTGILCCRSHNEAAVWNGDRARNFACASKLFATRLEAWHGR